MAKKKAKVEPETAPTLNKAKGVKTEGDGPKLRGEGSNYPLAEAFREAIRASGLPQNEIAVRAKIDKGVISRFMAGHRDLYGASYDQLMDVLGAKIVFKAPENGG